MSELPKAELNEEQELRNTLNRETSKMSWLELQKFYASGSVIAVTSGLDLIEVACQFSLDNKAAVGQWLEQGKVFKVDDQTAQAWFDHEITLWTIVVAPWVLVQEFAAEV